MEKERISISPNNSTCATSLVKVTDNCRLSGLWCRTFWMSPWKQRRNDNLKPLLPRPIPPLRKSKLEKRKATLQEFDPLHAVTRRKLGMNRGELLPLATAKQTLTKLPQFVLLIAERSRSDERIQSRCAYKPSTRV